MNNPAISRASTEFLIAAALLALFGVAALNNGGPHGPLQIALAVVMGGAGAFLRTGTPDARMVGLGAAALTVACGGYALVFQSGYIVGTIIAIFALVRLWGAGTQAQGPAQQLVIPPPASTPLAPFDAPDLYGGPPVAPSGGPPQTALPSQAPFFPATEPVPFFPAPLSKPEDPA
jgi:hypothetical protein